MAGYQKNIYICMCIYILLALSPVVESKSQITSFQGLELTPFMKVLICTWPCLYVCTTYQAGVTHLLFVVLLKYKTQCPFLSKEMCSSLSIFFTVKRENFPFYFLFILQREWIFICYLSNSWK